MNKELLEKMQWLYEQGFADYKITESGEIWSKRFHWLCNPNKGWRQLKGKLDTNGYLSIDLFNDAGKKRFRIHSLVAGVYIPNPLGLPCINHKDGNKLNNHMSNLERCDYSYNLQHAYNIGLRDKTPHKAIAAKPKKVFQLDLDGREIKLWNSRKEASDATGINASDIVAVIKGRQRTAGGFIWTDY